MRWRMYGLPPSIGEFKDVNSFMQELRKLMDKQ